MDVNRKRAIVEKLSDRFNNAIRSEVKKYQGILEKHGLTVSGVTIEVGISELDEPVKKRKKKKEFSDKKFLKSVGIKAE